MEGQKHSSNNDFLHQELTTTLKDKWKDDPRNHENQTIKKELESTLKFPKTFEVPELQLKVIRTISSEVQLYENGHDEGAKNMGKAK